MSTINGLPAHILLNHLVVVLGPLAAVLAVLCAVWPAARVRFIWIVEGLALITLVVTQLTTTSGVWLAARLGATPAIALHRDLGSKLTFVVAALAAAVTALAVVHLRQGRGQAASTSVHATVVALVILAAVATLVQTYRVGETGARAAWGTTASAQRSAASLAPPATMPGPPTS